MSAPGNKRRSKESARDDWRTPPNLFRILDSEFHFTLDVAADAENRKTERWLEGPCLGEGIQLDMTACGCGLCADWLEHRAFVNPPYSDVERWLDKARAAATRGALAVALVPNNTDNRWFRDLDADEIRLLTGRVQYDLPPGSDPKDSGNTGGSIVAVWWPYPQFRRVAPRIYAWDWQRQIRALAASLYTDGHHLRGATNVD